MLISCVCWLFRHLLGLVALRNRSDAENEVEILLLRHELAVLQMITEGVNELATCSRSAHSRADTGLRRDR